MAVTGESYGVTVEPAEALQHTARMLVATGRVLEVNAGTTATVHFDGQLGRAPVIDNSIVVHTEGADGNTTFAFAAGERGGLRATTYASPKGGGITRTRLETQGDGEVAEIGEAQLGDVQLEHSGPTPPSRPFTEVYRDFTSVDRALPSTLYRAVSAADPHRRPRVDSPNTLVDNDRTGTRVWVMASHVGPLVGKLMQTAGNGLLQGDPKRGSLSAEVNFDNRQLEGSDAERAPLGHQGVTLRAVGAKTGVTTHFELRVGRPATPDDLYVPVTCYVETQDPGKKRGRGARPAQHTVESLKMQPRGRGLHVQYREGIPGTLSLHETESRPAILDHAILTMARQVTSAVYRQPQAAPRRWLGWLRPARRTPAAL